MTEIKFKIGKSQHKVSFTMEPFADVFRGHLLSKGIKINRKLQGKDE